ncbi:MAG: hypothetical protein IT210_05785 [Armatimonadetes bacterium]|nr:hypothetical protein [Armatimonadota bacterium]
MKTPPSRSAETPSLVWAAAVALTGLAVSLFQPVAHPRLPTSLRLGDDLSKGLRLAGPDPISGNALPYGNLSSEWLFDMAAAFLHRVGGEPALLAARSLLWVILSWLLWRLLSRRLSLPVALASTALAWASLLPYAPFFPGPITAAALIWAANETAAYEEGRRKRLWHLPLAFLLWSNLHRGSVLGVIALAFFLGLSPDHSRLKHEWRLVGACAVTLLLTPGARFLWLYPTYLGIGPVARLTGENASPDFRLLPFRAAELLLFAVWAGWIAQASRPAAPSLPEAAGFRFCLLPTAAFIALLYTGSGLPLFIAVSLYSLAAMGEARKGQGGRRFGAAASVALFGTLLLWWAWNQPGNYGRWFPREGLPAEGAKQLRCLIAGENLAHPALWGGYLSRALEGKAFIDLRSEVYGRRFLEDYLKLANLSPGWENVPDRYRIRHILWPREGPLVQLLEASPGWRRIYADGECALIARLPEEGATSRAAPPSYYGGIRPASPCPRRAGSGAGKTRSYAR